MSRNLLSWLLGMIGAVIGGAVGYFLFGWILTQGLYAPLLPAALLGAGCGLLAKSRSFLRGLVCGVAGLALGVYAEWSHFPFKADRSFSFFVVHLQDLKPLTLIFIALGGFLAYWFGRDQLRGQYEEEPASRESRSP